MVAVLPFWVVTINGCMMPADHHSAFLVHLHVQISFHQYIVKQVLVVHLLPKKLAAHIEKFEQLLKLGFANLVLL